MKLYLSSYKFGDSPDQLKDLARTNTSGVVITNALDFGTDTARRIKSEQEQIDMLSKLGYKAEILDLRKYFNKPDLLKEKIETLGFI